MFTITINAKTPEEFKEAIKGLYCLFPDEGNAAPIIPLQPGKPAESKPIEPAKPAAVTASADSKAITVEDVRKAVQEKTTGNEANKAAIKEILSSYGAPSVTKLDASHYSEFLTKIKNIA